MQYFVQVIDFIEVFLMFNTNAGHELISLVHMVKTRKSNPSISTISKINFLFLFFCIHFQDTVPMALIGLSKD